ncbi:hypothetical protein COB72_00410 [bacterium]|nr:MAG: hypothetical protein COB72_00410 [bacterium]
MLAQSFLDDPDKMIVVDTSVVINLCSTGVARQIISSIPCRFVLVQEVMNELKFGPMKEQRGSKIYTELVTPDQMKIATLSEAGMEQFMDLVAGHTSDSLDDGEAATIAHALECNATAIIDERKANRICAERFSSLQTACTLDLLSHQSVHDTLGPSGIADATYHALLHGRMRVPKHFLDWVLTLIGPERAAQCTSLPKSVRATC